MFGLRGCLCIFLGDEWVFSGSLEGGWGGTLGLVSSWSFGEYFGWEFGDFFYFK